MQVHVLLSALVIVWFIHTANAAGRVVQLITGEQGVHSSCNWPMLLTPYSHTTLATKTAPAVEVICCQRIPACSAALQRIHQHLLQQTPMIHSIL